MKIAKIDMKSLKNNLHFQFHADVIALIEKTGATNLGIESQFKTYKENFANEDLALKKITKSAATAKIAEFDRKRENMYMSMIAINNATLRHWDSSIAESAKNLKIVFNTYGKINTLPFKEQTAAIINILQEFRGKYKADVSKVKISGWIEKMAEYNDEVSKFMQDRYEESAAQFCGSMRDCRKETDRAYGVICTLIHAFALIEDMIKYGLFVKTLNIIVSKYGGKTIKQDYGLGDSSSFGTDTGDNQSSANSGGE